MSACPPQWTAFGNQPDVQGYDNPAGQLQQLSIGYLWSAWPVRSGCPQNLTLPACSESPQGRAACYTLTHQGHLQPSPQLLGGLQADQGLLWPTSLQKQPQQVPACLA